MVDVVRHLRVQVPDRVVAYGCEVDDGVEADEVLSRDVANIGFDRLDLERVGAERAGSEEIGIKADNVVAGPLEDGTSTVPM